MAPAVSPFRKHTLNKLIAATVLAACATWAQADTSAAKKELVNKVLQLQRPLVEAQVRTLAERPAAQIMQSVNVLIQQRVPLEKREPLIKEIQADLRKYVDEATPVLRDNAVRLLPQTTGAVLTAKFSEAELKQLIGVLEAPAFRKYQQANEEMFRALLERLGPDSRADIEPKLRALDQSLRKRLEAAIGPSAPAAGPGPAPTPAPAKP
jgi:tellurite resistance protein